MNRTEGGGMNWICMLVGHKLVPIFKWNTWTDIIGWRCERCGEHGVGCGVFQIRARRQMKGEEVDGQD